MEVIVGEDGEDNGGIVDGEVGVDAIEKFGKFSREVVKGTKFGEDVVGKYAGDDARDRMDLGLSPRKDGFGGDEDLGEDWFRFKRKIIECCSFGGKVKNGSKGVFIKSDPNTFDQGRNGVIDMIYGKIGIKIPNEFGVVGDGVCGA